MVRCWSHGRSHQHIFFTAANLDTHGSIVTDPVPQGSIKEAILTIWSELMEMGGVGRLRLSPVQMIAAVQPAPATFIGYCERHLYIPFTYSRVTRSPTLNSQTVI